MTHCHLRFKLSRLLNILTPIVDQVYIKKLNVAIIIARNKSKNTNMDRICTSDAHLRQLLWGISLVQRVSIMSIVRARAKRLNNCNQRKGLMRLPRP